MLKTIARKGCDYIRKDESFWTLGDVSCGSGGQFVVFRREKGSKCSSFIHVAVVYANEIPLFICNIEFYIQSTINFFFYVFSYNGVYASPFGVPNTSLSLRLVVPRVPSAACIAGANWRYI